MILLIDNYDSFSYNLYQLVGTIDSDIKVIRNDEMTIDEIERLSPERIILSPGPGKPSDAGICEDVVRAFAGRIPIMGVCLGHQAICEVYGATVTYAVRLMHGKQSVASIDTETDIFKGLGNKMKVARYHSLAAKADTVPECLKVIAVSDDDGEVMAVKHRDYEVYGLQFHPESILTPEGMTILKNFISGKTENYKFTTPVSGGNANKEEKKVIREAIAKVADGQDLTYEEAYQVIEEIMSGETEQSQTAAFLTALHIKGEKAAEISGAAAAMRDKALKVEHPGTDVLEIVGTGGDRASTINISSTAAFIGAAAGIKVAKHGNRAASSKSGAADVLEALGGHLMIEPEDNERMLQDVGFIFMFAQKYHSAMKYVGPVRKAIGIPTIFNILGPLTNPAKPEYFVLGVYKPELIRPIAETLVKLGSKRGVVMHGQDVLDEISVSAKTTVCEYKNENGEVSFEEYEIDPADFGITGYTKDDIKGGTPEENAAITRGILKGEITGAKKEAVLLNAAAIIHVAEGLDYKAAYDKAAQQIENGKAYAVLEKYVEETGRL